MTIGDVEMFTIPLSDLIKHKIEILKDAKAVMLTPLLASLNVTNSFFGFGASNITEHYKGLQPNDAKLWIFLSLDGSLIQPSDKLAFGSSEYIYLKQFLH